MSTTLTFDESAAEFIVESFGAEIDDEGYIINPETEERETVADGEELHKHHFIGVEEGSIIYLDDDFNTLVEHVKRRRE